MADNYSSNCWTDDTSTAVTSIVPGGVKRLKWPCSIFRGSPQLAHWNWVWFKAVNSYWQTGHLSSIKLRFSHHWSPKNATTGVSSKKPTTIKNDLTTQPKPIDTNKHAMPSSISQLLIRGSFKDILGVPWFTVVSFGVFAGRRNSILLRNLGGRST